MFKILFFIFLTCAAVFAGPMLADSQGFVHISAGSYVIETSLTTAVSIYVLSILLLLLIIFIIKKAIAVPRRALRAFKIRAKRRHISIQDEAIIAYEQGEYKRAFSLVEHADPVEKMPEKTLLLAAKAAFKLKNYEFTRHALNEADKRDEDTKTAANVIRATMNFELGNPRTAIDFLNKLPGSAKNATVLEIYFKCYTALNEHSKIEEMSDDLLRYHIITKEYKHNLYLCSVERAIRDASSANELNAAIKKLVKKDKRDPRILAPLSYKYIRLGDVNKAQEIAMTLLKDKLDDGYLENISRWDIAVPDLLTHLKKYAQSNIITSQINLPLLKAIANLEFKSGQLREAMEDYLQALSIHPSEDIYLRLGAICTALQNYPKAAEYYSKAGNIINESAALTIKA